MPAAVDALHLPREQREALRATLHELVHYGRKLAASGLVVGTSGNLSVRVGDVTVITPTSVDYESISEEDLCVMSAGGQQLSGSGRPSSEYAMHRMIYDEWPAGAVIHTHSVSAVATSTVCDELPAVHYSILRLGGATVRVARYQTFGSDDLARSARSALEGRFAALLENHGVIAYGASLAEAYARAELVEWLSDVWLRSHQVGQPRILSEEELAAVADQARRRRYAGSQ